MNGLIVGWGVEDRTTEHRTATTLKYGYQKITSTSVCRSYAMANGVVCTSGQTPSVTCAVNQLFNSFVISAFLITPWVTYSKFTRKRFENSIFRYKRTKRTCLALRVWPYVSNHIFLYKCMRNSDWLTDYTHRRCVVTKLNASNIVTVCVTRQCCPLPLKPWTKISREIYHSRLLGVTNSLALNHSGKYGTKISWSRSASLDNIPSDQIWLVPKDLHFLQKELRVVFAKEMLANIADDPTSIKRIITGDEMWVYDYALRARFGRAPGNVPWADWGHKKNSLKELKAIPAEAYKKCMENCINRWHACIGPKRAYFEGDHEDVYWNTSKCCFF